MIDPFQSHPDADREHTASCTCPTCVPDAMSNIEAAEEAIKAAHKAGDRIAELGSGSRGRIKWIWVNKQSPFRRVLEGLARRSPAGCLAIPNSQLEALYRLATQPKNRYMGGDSTAGKAAKEELLILALADKLRATGEIEESKITTTILERWNSHYPDTKRPSRRTISRKLTGK